MSVLDIARVCIYRVNQKGLEIFLVNTGAEAEDWQIPKGRINKEPYSLNTSNEMIELEPIQKDGGSDQVLAIEGDWHEIPSIRAMIKDDVRIVTSHVIQKLPEVEQGAYFVVKEAFKKVLPEEYASLKELKDILIDRNQAKYI